MGPSPVRRVLPECLTGFIVSEINSDSEQTAEPTTVLISFLTGSSLSCPKIS
jgi:hypothetical protein